MDKCLVFDVWGQYGHFKKFYTTSSPLTFSFPPRPSIIGMIAAIIGMDKKDYLKAFDKENTYIALQIRKPIKKVRIGINLIDTKRAKQYMSKIDGRTQVMQELIKDAEFRIYFYHKNNDVYNRLKMMLDRHQTFYTLCLGLSEHIANYRYVGEFTIESRQDERVDIVSVIPYRENMEIEFETGLEYYKEVMPNHINPDREVEEYSKILFEKNGKPIRCKPKQYWKVGNNDDILFL